MFENELLQYGIAGVFILYLIYDRQVLIKSLQKAIDQNTTAILALTEKIKK